MTFVGKILVILNMALSLVFLGVTTVAFTTSANWKQETENQKKQVAVLTTKVKTAEADKAAFQNQLTQAKAEFEAANKELATKNVDLTATNNNTRDELTQARTALTDAQTNAGLAVAESQARTADLTDEERILSRELFLITAKPQLYVANVDEAGLTIGNAYTEAVEKRANEEGSQVVRICGALEAEIAQLEPAERTEFLESLGLKEPGLNRLIHSAYALLDLITCFTAGVQEVRAWTIKRGTKAPGAAGVIHSDFEKGFIKADCYASDDLFKYGSEQAVKEKGLLRSEGKDYVVKDGDILFFKFNV